MYIVQRTAQFVRGAILSFGPTFLKKRVWDKEFHTGHWNFLDKTIGDCVYPFLEKYARKGSVLDLGCGPGNTANEMNVASYSDYLGVDISVEALAKARARTKENGRADKNRFAAGDFLAYEPEGSFDVILFRESMYHVPIGKIKPLLDRLSHHLSEDGVFIVRMQITHDGQAKRRPTKMVETIAGAFDMIEQGHDPKSGGAVLVFKPKVRTQSTQPRYEPMVTKR